MQNRAAPNDITGKKTQKQQQQRKLVYSVFFKHPFLLYCFLYLLIFCLFCFVFTFSTSFCLGLSVREFTAITKCRHSGQEHIKGKNPTRRKKTNDN